jgi:autotransporter-associated beta strand protein
MEGDLERHKDALVGRGAGHMRRTSGGLMRRKGWLLGATAVAALCLPGTAQGATNIEAGNTYLASALGNTVNPNFAGGTLQLDSSTTIDKAFTLQDFPGNTIDVHGSTVTMSGVFSGAGGFTVTDTAGGGVVTISNANNTYTGATAIDAGATLAISELGTIATSSKLTDNGTFDISAATAGTSITSLAGSGSVVLGSNNLTITNAADTFSGTISGAGGLWLSGGTEVITSAQSFTGAATVTTGTLKLTGNGSLASSNVVYINGTLDIAETPGASLKSLSGSGTVVMGDRTLTLTNANGVFTGSFSGNGTLVLQSGIELLTGNNTFVNPVIVNGGTLEVASSAIAYNVIDNASFVFYGSGQIAMSGVISGAGDVALNGGGITTITSVQTYTGATNITLGRLALSGAGNIASSSDVNVSGTFDIGATSGTSITSLSGTGGVYLGSQVLTLTNAAGNFSGTISGAGGLTIAGGSETLSGANTYTGVTTVNAGSLILTAGSSLLSSSVIVNNGALLDISQASETYYSLGSSIASLAGNGTVTLGSKILYLTNANDTFGGVISGLGGLTVNGGSETLSGVNTYTGATTIGQNGMLILSATGSISSQSSIMDDGVLDISAAAGPTLGFASLGGSGTVNLGTRNLSLSNAADVFSGTITGSGALVIDGGMETLTGANSYTGGTIINAGTLQIGNRYNSGSIAGDVLDNGTLAFARTNTLVFDGVISGTGAVVQAGAGTTILTAGSSYTGGTTITAGTLQIGNNTATGSIHGDVTDNGTLAFARSDSTTFDGIISGTGGVHQMFGITTLTAAESYSGATVIDSGASLVLGAGSSIAASSGVAANGSFDVSASAAPQITSLSGSGSVLLGGRTLTLSNASGAFSGVISGNGGLTLNGGSETLSGINSYTGMTTINGGKLVVNGSIAASPGVAVNAGGTLAGTGSVSSVTVASGGTLAAGANGAGTLTVNGNVAFADGSNFVVGANAAGASTLAVSGTASLGGTLSIASSDGTYPLHQLLTVLTADGGIAGHFTSLTPLPSTGAVFAPKLMDCGAKSVCIEIDLSKLSPLLPANVTANQKNAIAAIDAAILAGDTLPAGIENLGNDTSSGLASDAAQLAGEIGGDVPMAGRAVMTPFLDAIFNHIGDSRAAGPFRTPGQQSEAWATGFGGTGLSDGDPSGAGSHKFRSNVAGFAGGANWAASPHFMLGAALSAGISDFRLSDGVGKGKATAIQAAVYGQVRYSPHFYGSFAAAAGMDMITTHRLLTVSGSDDLSGKVTAYTLAGRYETGIVLPFATPYVAFQDILTVMPAFSEKADSGSAAFALRYASHTDNNGSVEVGVREGTDVDFTPRWLLTPDGTLHLSAKLAWAHNFLEDTNADASFAALPSSSFAIYHANPGKDAGLLTLGADLRFNTGLSVSVNLDSAVSSTSQSYTGMAGLRYTW